MFAVDGGHRIFGSRIACLITTSVHKYIRDSALDSVIILCFIEEELSFPEHPLNVPVAAVLQILFHRLFLHKIIIWLRPHALAQKLAVFINLAHKLQFHVQVVPLIIVHKVSVEVHFPGPIDEQILADIVNSVICRDMMQLVCNIIPVIEKLCRDLTYLFVPVLKFRHATLNNYESRRLNQVERAVAQTTEITVRSL